MHDLKTDSIGFAKFRDIPVSGDIICNNDLVKERYDAKRTELFPLHLCRSVNEQPKAYASISQLLQQLHNTIIRLYHRAVLFVDAQTLLCHFVRI